MRTVKEIRKERKILFIIILLIAATEAKAFYEDFEDGDYTQNPAWLLTGTYHWQEVVDSPTDPANKVIRIHGTKEGATTIVTNLSEPITFRDFCISYDFYVGEYDFCPEPTLQSEDSAIRLRMVADKDFDIGKFYFVTIFYDAGRTDLSTVYPSSIFDLNTWHKYMVYYDETNNAMMHELYNIETGNLIATAVHSLSDVNFDINKSINWIYFGCEDTAWQYFDNISLIPEPTIIPTPSAIVLCGIGMGFVSWLLRRRIF
jgi:hypothetical protein